LVEFRRVESDLAELDLAELGFSDPRLSDSGTADLEPLELGTPEEERLPAD
jgi:hypothetical protein